MFCISSHYCIFYCMRLFVWNCGVVSVYISIKLNRCTDVGTYMLFPARPVHCAGQNRSNPGSRSLLAGTSAPVRPGGGGSGCAITRDITHGSLGRRPAGPPLHHTWPPPSPGRPNPIHCPDNMNQTNSELHLSVPSPKNTCLNRKPPSAKSAAVDGVAVDPWTTGDTAATGRCSQRQGEPLHLDGGQWSPAGGPAAKGLHLRIPPHGPSRPSKAYRSRAEPSRAVTWRPVRGSRGAADGGRRTADGGRRTAETLPRCSPHRGLSLTHMLII